MIKVLAVLFLLLPSSRHLSAQQTSSIPLDSTLKDAYHVLHYDSYCGLPGDQIKSMYLDPYGFLWIFTPYGCIRFDGHYFDSYKPGEGHQSRVYRVVDDVHDHNKKYIAFFDTLAVIDKGNFSFISGKKDVLRRSSHNLLHTRQRIDKDTHRYLKDHSRFHEKIYNLGYDCFYQVLDNNVLFYKNFRIQDTLDVELSNGIECSFFHSRSLYLLDKEFKIQEISDLQHYKTHRIPIHIQALMNSANSKYKFVESSGNVFLLIKNRIIQLHFEGNNIRWEILLHSIKTEGITDVELMQRDIFIAYKDNGLYHLKSKPFSSSHLGGTKFYADNHIALNDSVIITRSHRIHNRYEIHNSEIQLERMALGSDNIKYLQNRDHIFRVDRNDHIDTIFTLKENQTIETLDYSSDGDLWLTTSDDSIWPQAQIHKIDSLASIQSWDSLIERGVFNRVSNEEGKIEYYSLKSLYELDKRNMNVAFRGEIPNLEIRSVLELGDGLTILATYNKGIWVKKESEFIPLKFHNRNSINASCALMDELGFVWITSNQGLFRFHPKNLRQYLNDQNQPLYHQYFDRSAGLGNKEFNGARPCGVVLDSTTISFPNLWGLSYINYRDSILNAVPKNKIVVDMEVDGSVIAASEKISIHSGIKKLKFHIRTANYEGTDNLHLYYRLIGFDDEWQHYDFEDPLYTSLRPGSYTLEIMRLTGHDENQRIRRMININVRKSWTEILKQIVLFIVLPLLTVVFIQIARIRLLKQNQTRLEEKVASRTHEVEELNKTLENNLNEISSINNSLQNSIKVKNRILGVISHEILGAISIIRNISKDSQHPSIINDASRVSQNLSGIFSSSSETFTLLKNILSWSKIQNKRLKVSKIEFDLDEAIRTICKKIEFEAQLKNIRLKAPRSEQSFIYTDKTIFLVVIHTLLENEIKYSKNCTVEIQSKKEGFFRVVTILNSSSSLDMDLQGLNDYFRGDEEDITKSEILKGGLGLEIVRTLLKEIHGTIAYQKTKEMSHKIELKFDSRHAVSKT